MISVPPTLPRFATIGITIGLVVLIAAVLIAPKTDPGFGPAAVLAAASAFVLLREETSPWRSNFSRPLLAYMACVVLATMASTNRALSYPDLARTSSFVLVAALAATVASHSNLRRWLVGAIGMSTAILGSIAVAEMLARFLPYKQGVRLGNTWTGFWEGYPEIALFSSIGAAILLGIAVTSRRRSLKAAGIVAAIPPVLFIALSYARAAWIALGLAFCWAAYVFAKRYNRTRFFWWLAAIAVVWLAWARLANFKLPTEDAPLVSFASFQVALGSRLDIWRDTLAMIDDYPWLGSGPGTYDQVFKGHYAPTAIGFHAHNSFLHVAAETGIPSAICFGWIWWVILRDSYRRTVQPRPIEFAIHLALVVLFTRILLDHFFAGLPSSTRTGLLGFVLMGLGTGWGSKAEE